MNMQIHGRKRMGKMKELFVSGDKNQWDNNYIAFLEKQIEIKDKALKEIKFNLDKMEEVLNNNKKETS
tara:strand:- start:53 stop:256 length:204 start_codon:yes stop_codon:yes gene_type:complete